jgi:hypothetical protein
MHFMTDEQAKQIIKSLNECVEGIRELRLNRLELMLDITDLKASLVKIETELKEQKKNSEKVLDILGGESIRTKARVDLLEQKELSN